MVGSPIINRSTRFTQHDVAHCASHSYTVNHKVHTPMDMKDERP